MFGDFVEPDDGSEDERQRMLQQECFQLCHRLGQVRRALCGKVWDMDVRKKLFDDQYDIIDAIARTLGYLK